MLERGDTFLTGDEDDATLHLWIILTPPSEGEVVTVSVTTRRRKSEALVVLKPGDHPFVQRESVIAYAFARIRTVEEIEAAVANGSAKRREPIKAEILARIAAGLLDSEFTPNGIKHFYRSIAQ